MNASTEEQDAPPLPDSIGHQLKGVGDTQVQSHARHPPFWRDSPTPLTLRQVLRSLSPIWSLRGTGCPSEEPLLRGRVRRASIGTVTSFPFARIPGLIERAATRHPARRFRSLTASGILNSAWHIRSVHSPRNRPNAQHESAQGRGHTFVNPTEMALVASSRSRHYSQIDRRRAETTGRFRAARRSGRTFVTDLYTATVAAATRASIRNPASTATACTSRSGSACWSSSWASSTGCTQSAASDCPPTISQPRQAGSSVTSAPLLPQSSWPGECSTHPAPRSGECGTAISLTCPASGRSAPTVLRTWVKSVAGVACGSENPGITPTSQAR